MHDQPLAYFITITVYGTFLQGDARWWRSRGKGSQFPQPFLEQVISYTTEEQDRKARDSQ
ncbi:hypothetical protein [uncultured Gimesia sp.]|jgi:hypothetical protein|uniref:hypothetical protein n=1 Tax=uncultured Gimesia sp. TaxID=1678688 RepID=UPI00260A8CF3|nr:hypothetical protein [uncultured Gimesia sp.]